MSGPWRVLDDAHGHRKPTRLHVPGACRMDGANRGYGPAVPGKLVGAQLPPAWRTPHGAELRLPPCPTCAREVYAP